MDHIHIYTYYSHRTLAHISALLNIPLAKPPYALALLSLRYVKVDDSSYRVGELRLRLSKAINAYTGSINANQMGP